METFSKIRFMALELNSYKMTNQRAEHFSSSLSGRPSQQRTNHFVGPSWVDES